MLTPKQEAQIERTTLRRRPQAQEEKPWHA